MRHLQPVGPNTQNPIRVVNLVDIIEENGNRVIDSVRMPYGHGYLSDRGWTLDLVGGEDPSASIFALGKLAFGITATDYRFQGIGNHTGTFITPTRRKLGYMSFMTDNPNHNLGRERLVDDLISVMNESLVGLNSPLRMPTR